MIKLIDTGDVEKSAGLGKGRNRKGDNQTFQLSISEANGSW